MIKIFLCLSLYLALNTHPSQDNFYDQVLNDFGRGSNFVAIDVLSKKYQGKVIIENGQLYDFLNKTKRLNKQEYKTFMKKLLENKEKLVLKKVKIDKSGLYMYASDIIGEVFLVKQNQEVEENAAKGCTDFVRSYFDKDVLLSEAILGLEKLGLVTAKLFEWGITVRSIEITGSYAVSKNSCQ